MFNVHFFKFLNKSRYFDVDMMMMDMKMQQY